MIEVNHGTLRQLTRDQLRELQDGEQRYVRLWRAYDPTPLLVFEGTLPLSVSRHLRHGGKEGELQAVVITTQQPANWAEYLVWHRLPREYPSAEADGTMVVEDWCMVVYGPDGQGVPWRPADESDEGEYEYLRWDRESIREARAQGLGQFTQQHPRAKYEGGRLVI